jgi:hypothetical protein
MVKFLTPCNDFHEAHKNLPKERWQYSEGCCICDTIRNLHCIIRGEADLPVWTTEDEAILVIIREIKELVQGKTNESFIEFPA